MPDLRTPGTTHFLPSSSSGSITLRDYEIEEPADSDPVDRKS